MITNEQMMEINKFGLPMTTIQWRKINKIYDQELQKKDEEIQKLKDMLDVDVETNLSCYHCGAIPMIITDVHYRKELKKQQDEFRKVLEGLKEKKECGHIEFDYDCEDCHLHHDDIAAINNKIDAALERMKR